MPDPISIFISAGEASGEAYGALLIASLQKKLRVLNREGAFMGMGGERMGSAGLERIVRAEDMAVMGITEVVRHLPRIYREFRRLKHAIRQRRPALAILIDFPDIHFKLAEEFHRLGIPVLFFVSPQLWAWKKHRIKLVQKYVDRMLVIFPFEETFYRERGVQAEFVGHPLADLASAHNLPRTVRRRKPARPPKDLDRPPPRQPCQRNPRQPAGDARRSTLTRRKHRPEECGEASSNRSRGRECEGCEPQPIH